MPSKLDTAAPPNRLLKQAFRHIREGLNDKATEIEYLAEAQKTAGYEAAAAEYQERVERLEGDVLGLSKESGEHEGRGEGED